jgi:hypothetical protein
MLKIINKLIFTVQTSPICLCQFDKFNLFNEFVASTQNYGFCIKLIKINDVSILFELKENTLSKVD